MSGIQGVTQRQGVSGQAPTSLGVAFPTHIDANRLSADIRQLADRIPFGAPYDTATVAEAGRLSRRVGVASITANLAQHKKLEGSMLALRSKLLSMKDMPVEHWLQLFRAPTAGFDGMASIAA